MYTISRLSGCEEVLGPTPWRAKSSGHISWEVDYVPFACFIRETRNGPMFWKAQRVFATLHNYVPWMSQIIFSVFFICLQNTKKSTREYFRGLVVTMWRSAVSESPRRRAPRIPLEKDRFGRSNLDSIQSFYAANLQHYHKSISLRFWHDFCPLRIPHLPTSPSVEGSVLRRVYRVSHSQRYYYLYKSLYITIELLYIQPYSALLCSIDIVGKVRSSGRVAATALRHRTPRE